MFNGLGTVLMTLFIGSILFIITGVYCIYLVYEQHYGNFTYKTKNIVIPDRKIITTNNNGNITIDTTYYYKFSK